MSVTVSNSRQKNTCRSRVSELAIMSAASRHLESAVRAITPAFCVNLPTQFTGRSLRPRPSSLASRGRGGGQSINVTKVESQFKQREFYDTTERLKAE
ncbi:hypothetical protein PoB_001841800 [Plakobranchus ocellatus]|uniref:Uncharacterized protein n=1 Tax=Plakobranchus ocellatus TaxID=259542 RepID=A0AAV3ZBZ2_9GAST|nr:hypothetical protein PoB_001841800 [Plakobranchus ocellatus]